MTKIAAILTDFGTRDSYVGTMKAVMLSIDPALRIVDITHAIQPQNVRQAAFTLMNCFRYFPAGTVFCAVVDPGVGSARKPIAAQCGDYYFVAPDNGLISYSLLQLARDYLVVSLDKPDYHLPATSHTFHGRDIFAPAAAHIASDATRLKDMGPVLERIVALPKPRLSVSSERVTGEVMHIDHFGNIITSIGSLYWMADNELALDALWQDNSPALRFSAASAHLTIGRHSIHGVSRAYHEARIGAALAQIDSSGFLEVAVNQGNAALRFDAQLGDEVALRLKSI